MTSIQTLVRGSGLIYDVTPSSILLLTPRPVKVRIERLNGTAKVTLGVCMFTAKAHMQALSSLDWIFRTENEEAGRKHSPQSQII